MGTDDLSGNDELRAAYQKAKDDGCPVWEGPEKIWCSICRNPHPAKDIIHCTNCWGNFCPECRHGRIEGDRCVGPCSYDKPYNPA